jgi:hypothetical protein
MFGSLRPDLGKCPNASNARVRSVFRSKFRKMRFPRNPKLGAQKILKTKKPKILKNKNATTKNFKHIKTKNLKNKKT